MSQVLFEDPLSNPNKGILSYIQNLDSNKYIFILLVGMNDNPKTEFFNNIVKSSNIETNNKESSAYSKSLDQASKNDLPPKAAELYIEEDKKIWCNTKDLTSPNLSADKLYIKELAKNSSRVVFFIELNSINGLRDCEIYLDYIMDNNMKYYLDLLICVSIVKPSLSPHLIENSMNSNYYSKLKQDLKCFQLLIIPYPGLDVYNSDYSNEFNNLKRDICKNPTIFEPNTFLKFYSNKNNKEPQKAKQTIPNQNLKINNEENLNKLLGLDKKKEDKPPVIHQISD